jgi:hypothetical protein
MHEENVGCRLDEGAVLEDALLDKPRPKGETRHEFLVNCHSLVDFHLSCFWVGRRVVGLTQCGVTCVTGKRQ